MLKVLHSAACVALVWALVAVATEGAFRLIGDRPSLDLGGLYASQGGGLYKLRSNVDTEAYWSSGRLTVHTDELGMRCDGARRFATRPGDRLDVLLLGDSQGFGHGVSFGDSLAGACAEEAATDGFRMANASVPGHSAATQLALAEWLESREHVRASTYVLLATPAIIAGGDHLSYARVGTDGRLYDLGAGRMAAVRVWIKTHIVSYARIRDAARNSGIGIEPAADTPAMYAFYQTGEPEQRLTRTFTEFVAKLKAFADSQGARLQIAYIPLTFEADFEPIRHAAAGRGITVDRDAPLRACEAAAARSGVLLANLRPTLERMHREGDLLHLRGDFHYDRATSKACASSLWSALRPAVSHPAFASLRSS